MADELEDRDDGIVQSKTHTTITRIFGYRLPNGRYLEAPVEVWMAALLDVLDPKIIEAMFPVIEAMKKDMEITTLSDGMALVHKPIFGLRDS